MRKLIFCFICVVMLFSVSGCNDIEGEIKDLGYIALRPPSMVLPPGTVVEVMEKEPFEGSLVCLQSQSLGSNPQLATSPSVTINKNLSSDTKFSLAADYLELIKGKAGLGVVKDIEFSLSNVEIIELPYAEVLNKINDRSNECQTVINDMKQQGKNISMISSVIKADVTYYVKFDSTASLDLAAQASVLKGLAPELGVSNETISGSNISGESLYWGIKDNSSLLDYAKDITASTKPATTPSNSTTAVLSLSPKLRVISGVAPKKLPSESVLKKFRATGSN